LNTVPQKTTYHENIDSSLYNYSIDVRMLFVLRETEGIAYLTGVGHDVGDVLRGVHSLGAVRALLRDFRVIGHYEREALAVDDMPVERVDLGFGRSPSGARLEYA
jgi:hypothetical protein